MLQLLEGTLYNLFSLQEIPVKVYYIKVPAHGISNTLIFFFPYNVFFIHIHPLLLSNSSLKGTVMVIL